MVELVYETAEHAEIDLPEEDLDISNDLQASVREVWRRCHMLQREKNEVDGKLKKTKNELEISEKKNETMAETHSQDIQQLQLENSNLRSALQIAQTMHETMKSCLQICAKEMDTHNELVQSSATILQNLAKQADTHHELLQSLARIWTNAYEIRLRTAGEGR